MNAPYRPDLRLSGKLRRRLTRLHARRPARSAPPRPMVTFGFDDAPVSSLRAGAPVLEARGLKGVWYIAMGLCGATAHLGRYMDAAEVAEAHARGHEIGCHTFSHDDCALQTSHVFAEDVDRNRDALHALGCATDTFAYPYGEVAPGPKREAGRRFTVARTAQAGLIRRGADLAQAPGVGLMGPDGEAVALHWLSRAAAEGAWLMLFTHDVQAQPTAWGCTPGALARVADAALRLGVDVVTAAEGARRMGAAA